MSHELNLNETKKEYHGSYQSYLIGFVFSLILTSASFLLVITQAIRGKYLVYALIVLAISQAIIQTKYFLHVGKEDKPRWELVAYNFMVMVLLIVVLGSLWIMSDLNDRVMDTMKGAM